MGGENSSRPLRILITDDERDLAEMLAFSLGRRGYEIARACDGREAWERMKEEKFDLLILDLMMPGLDGWEVCALIRESEDPKIREIPILILSARAMGEDRVRGLEMGAEDYLAKPFSLMELILRIEKLLNRRQAFASLKSELDVLKQQAREREERVCKIVHDLKTPLVSLGASAKLLMKTREKDEDLEMLRGIYESSHRLNRRLEEILLFSVSSFSEKKIPMKEFSLPSLADRLRESFQALAREKTIEMKFYPFSAFPLLWGDERWLERALENLLGNALKYTPEGGRVEIGGSMCPEEGTVEIWVQDNGRGIFPEEMQQIFHPFHRGRNALNEPGMGLGLSLVKEVVDLHGGKILVESQPQEGSRFSIVLPMGKNVRRKGGDKTAENFTNN
jgi:two-component system sensor histidine kinase/response regulator